MEVNRLMFPTLGVEGSTERGFEHDVVGEKAGAYVIGR